MLIRPGSDKPFPKNDLSYLAFLVTVEQMYLVFQLVREAREQAPEDEPVDEPPGFLWRVPYLANVPAAVQVDLLAEVWARHDAARVYRATLLDAAVLDCACRFAAEMIREQAETVRLCVQDSPRQLDIRLDRWTRDRLEVLYQRWWPGFDPREVQSATAPVLGDFPPPLVTPLLEAVNRREPSPELGRRLRGLMSPRDIRDFLLLLQQ